MIRLTVRQHAGRPRIGLRFYDFRSAARCFEPVSVRQLYYKMIETFLLHVVWCCDAQTLCDARPQSAPNEWYKVRSPGVAQTFRCDGEAGRDEEATRRGDEEVTRRERDEGMVPAYAEMK